MSKKITDALEHITDKMRDVSGEKLDLKLMLLMPEYGPSKEKLMKDLDLI